MTVIIEHDEKTVIVVDRVPSEVVREVVREVSVVKDFKQGPPGPTGTTGSAGPSGPAGPAGPSGSTPTQYTITNTASFSTSHSYPYPPSALLLDEAGQEVDTDVTHNPGQISLSFAIPFTGTLYLS